MIIIKKLLTAIGIFIVAQLLLAFLFPGGGMKSLLNIALVGCFLLALFSLSFGRKGTALRGATRTGGLLVGMTIATIVIALLTAATSRSADSGFDLVSMFVKEVVPFGRYIGTALKVVKISAEAQPLSTPVLIARDIAKLVLETIIDPILSGFLFVFIFENAPRAHESVEDYSRRSHQDFLSFSPIYQRARKWSFKGAVAGLFGAVYSAYAATLVFNIGTDLLAEKVGEPLMVIIIFIITLLLLFLILLMPIAKTGFSIAQPNRKFLLINLLISLGKMIALNIVVVLIVRMFAGTAY